jgi:hypothetical protein
MCGQTRGRWTTEIGIHALLLNKILFYKLILLIYLVYLHYYFVVEIFISDFMRTERILLLLTLFSLSRTQFLFFSYSLFHMHYTYVIIQLDTHYRLMEGGNYILYFPLLTPLPTFRDRSTSSSTTAAATTTIFIIAGFRDSRTKNAAILVCML